MVHRSTVNGSSMVTSSSPSFKVACGGNIRIVSILRCVSAGYQERLVSQGAAVHFQFIGFRTVLQAFEQSLFQISEWSSPSRLGELQAYKCVESHAAGAEERHIVDFSVVNDV